MGGLFLDVLIVYLIRVLIRGIRLLHSDGWPVRKAILLGAVSSGSVFGCAVATVQ
jgi:hypothetical protein